MNCGSGVSTSKILVILRLKSRCIKSLKLLNALNNLLNILKFKICTKAEVIASVMVYVDCQAKRYFDMKSLGSHLKKISNDCIFLSTMPNHGFLHMKLYKSLKRLY